MKAVGVAFMVASHVFVWLLTTNDHQLTAAGLRFFTEVPSTRLFMFAPITIPAMAGMIYRVRLDKYIVDDRLLNLPLRIILWETVFLAVMETLINVATWGWSHVLVWDVLKFTALAVLVIVLISKLSVNWVAILSLAVLLATPWVLPPLRAFGGPVGRILVGDNGVFYFWPFFPWFAVVGVGYWLMHLLMVTTHKARLVKMLATVGVVYSLLAIFVIDYTWHIDPAHVWGDATQQPPVRSFVGYFGFLFLLVAACSWMARARKPRPRGLVNCYSQGILWIYALHIPVGFHLAAWIRPTFAEHLILATTLLIFLMLALSWGVGLASIKLLYEKRYVVHFVPKWARGPDRP